MSSPMTGVLMESLVGYDTDIVTSLQMLIEVGKWSKFDGID